MLLSFAHLAAHQTFGAHPYLGEVFSNRDVERVFVFDDDVMLELSSFVFKTNDDSEELKSI